LVRYNLRILVSRTYRVGQLDDHQGDRSDAEMRARITRVLLL